MLVRCIPLNGDAPLETEGPVKGVSEEEEVEEGVPSKFEVK